MAEGTQVHRANTWRRAGVAVFAVAAFLLVSMGGAIVAAPVTVPLMFVASRRHPTRAFRIAATVLGGLTVAEAVWALTYVLTADVTPWIWAFPLAGGTIAAVVLAGGARPRRGSVATVNPVGTARPS